MSSEREDRYDALQRFIREAAEALSMPENSERVQSLAALKLARLVQTERMLDGGNDGATLIGLTEAIGKAAPDKQLPKILVEIVEGVRGVYTCKHCHQQNTLEPGAYTPAPEQPRDYPRTIDSEVVKPAPVAAKQLPPPGPKPIRNADGTVDRQPHTNAPLRTIDYGSVFAGADVPFRNGVFGTRDPGW